MSIIQEAVDFVMLAVMFAMDIFHDAIFAVDGWGLIFAGISMILISRFLLGPIVGFTGSGASDIVRRSKRSKGDGNG